MDALFRFQTADLTDEQRDGLTGEVIAQGESSDLHPDVAVEELDQETLRTLVRKALETAYNRAQSGPAGPPDEYEDLIEEEILRALTGEPRTALVGNVVFSGDGSFWETLQERGFSNPVRRDPAFGTSAVFKPYLDLFDPNDPDDGPLYLMYGDADGGTVYAPDCGDSYELERRLTRALGDTDWTLDDHGIAVPQTTLSEEEDG